jgi:hypothetical protein
MVAPIPSTLPYRTRNPAHYGRDRQRVLSAFRAFGRELTMGEVGFLVLNNTARADRDELLGDLVAEGMLVCREFVCPTAKFGFSRRYRLPCDPEGSPT